VPPVSNWITQQLVRYLSALAPGPDDRPSRSATLRAGAERAAEAVEAEVGAVVWEGRVAVSLGFGPSGYSLAAIRAVIAGSTDRLAVTPDGAHYAVAMPVGEAGHLVLARSTDAFNREELILIRALGRILSLSIRSVDAVTAERSLRRESERRAREALRDPLTGLPNRTLFLDRLQTAVAKAERHGRTTAVLFMDLDGFKLVNDTLGHAAGDELLRAVAVRVADATRMGDTVARLGGDEFAVLIDDITTPISAIAVADRILSALVPPFVIGGRQRPVAASIGIALGPCPGEAADVLLRDADLAMYRAKSERNGGWRLFSPEMRDELVNRLELEHELRSSIGEGGLVCLYQPIVSLVDGRLTGLESLVRWLHPHRGLLSPAEFLPLAEETGLISQVDEWVMDETCRQMSRWRSLYRPALDLNAAVNLSGERLAAGGLAEHVARKLDDWSLPAERLVLEISEGAIFSAGSGAEMSLLELAELGSRLALDDFGTGYSSLGRLRDLRVDILKIDRSFVTGVDADARLSALTRNMVRLSRDLGLDVVAEGIETAAEEEFLRRAGCTYAQGYRFSRPVPGESIEALLLGAGEAPGVILPCADQVKLSAVSGG
jgi:diguanylate cyclase (GGDEF)-like protein